MRWDVSENLIIHHQSLFSSCTHQFYYLPLLEICPVHRKRHNVHAHIHTHTFTHRHRHTLQANAWPSLENSRFIKMQGTFNQSFLFAFLLIIIKKNYSKYGMWTITYFLNVGLNYSPLFFFLHLGNRLNIAVQDMHSIFKVRFWFCLSKW